MNPKMTTSYFKVLEAVYDNQMQIGSELYCPLGQYEIATILNYNRMTVNNILKELKADGYILCEKNKRYVITPKGRDAMQKAKEID